MEVNIYFLLVYNLSFLSFGLSWDINELNTVVRSQTQTLKSVLHHLRKTDPLWEWFHQHERGLEAVLKDFHGRSSQVSASLEAMPNTYVLLESLNDSLTTLEGQTAVKMFGIDEQIIDLNSKHAQLEDLLEAAWKQRMVSLESQIVLTKEELLKKSNQTDALIDEVETACQARSKLDTTNSKMQEKLQSMESKLNTLERTVSYLYDENKMERRTIRDLESKLAALDLQERENKRSAIVRATGDKILSSILRGDKTEFLLDQKEENNAVSDKNVGNHIEEVFNAAASIPAIGPQANGDPYAKVLYNRPYATVASSNDEKSQSNLD